MQSRQFPSQTEKMAPTPKTTFMVLSDTHNLESIDDLKSTASPVPMPKVDVLLHCKSAA